jgi:glycosyltransferase involved in cell wall biosynthesis
VPAQPDGRDHATRVVRLIARLNIGGPAIQVITLARRLESLGYETTVIRGQEAPREGNMDDLADAWGVSTQRISSLRRDPSWRDLPALVRLIAELRRIRPQLLHTHAAKAGTLGRIAAVLAYPRSASRPVLVHTFHGHSLAGAFSSWSSRLYIRIERFLATRTDRLIAVSAEVRDELIELGVAQAEKFEVVHLGFELSRFTVGDDARERGREAIRTELGIGPEEKVVSIIARLVPVKRIDRFLKAGLALSDVENVRFLVVGDGELYQSLRDSAEGRRLGDRVIWTGFRRDIAEICFASDVAALCSDVEGTPVCLIEAAAAMVPAVTMDVQGTSTVVKDGRTGFVVPHGDQEAFEKRLRTLLTDDELRYRLGVEAREHAIGHFTLDRLVSDIDGLYRRLLRARLSRSNA